MKLRPIVELNARGLNTPAKKFAAASKALRGATLPSPVQTIIKAGVAAIPARLITPAVAAVPAKPAIIGTGTAASPQFPAVAAVPAKVAVYSPAVPAVQPIKSPLVNPLPQWIGSVAIDVDLSTNIEHHQLYLPYSASAEALGATIDVGQIMEITQPGFDLGAYVELGILPTPATETEFKVNGVTATTEQYCYANALLLTAVAGHANTIEQTLYKPNTASPSIPCFKIDVYVPSTVSSVGMIYRLNDYGTVTAPNYRADIDIIEIPNTMEVVIKSVDPTQPAITYNGFLVKPGTVEIINTQHGMTDFTVSFIGEGLLAGQSVGMVRYINPN